MADHVLVPMDGSDSARKALNHAVETHPDATLTVLHVIDPTESYATGAGEISAPPTWYDDAEEDAEALFDRVREQIGSETELRTETTMGKPARAIVEFAEESGVDAIVMGSRGRDGLSRVVLGSVAETVVRRSPVPVTVVR